MFELANKCEQSFQMGCDGSKERSGTRRDIFPICFLVLSFFFHATCQF